MNDLFSKIPDVVALQIFNSLDLDSFLACGQVCQQWKALANTPWCQPQRDRVEEFGRRTWALDEAAKMGACHLAEHLIHNGTDDVNGWCWCEIHENPPLCIAMRHGHYKMVELLVKNGAQYEKRRRPCYRVALCCPSR